MTRQKNGNRALTPSEAWSNQRIKSRAAFRRIVNSPKNKSNCVENQHVPDWVSEVAIAYLWGQAFIIVIAVVGILIAYVVLT